MQEVLDTFIGEENISLQGALFASHRKGEISCRLDDFSFENDNYGIVITLSLIDETSNKAEKIQVRAYRENIGVGKALLAALEALKEGLVNPEKEITVAKQKQYVLTTKDKSKIYIGKADFKNKMILFYSSSNPIIKIKTEYFGSLIKKLEDAANEAESFAYELVSPLLR